MRWITIFFIAASVHAQEITSIVISDTLTLQQCVTIALQNQPALGASQGAVITAESEFTQVRSSFFPQAQFEAGAFMTNTPLQHPNIIAPTPTVDTESKTQFIPSLRLSIKQPIYDFGRTAKALESKRKLIEASERSLSSTEDDVVLNVHLAYYNYLLAQSVVKIQEDRVNQAKKHLERASGFFEVGKIPESEVSKAELEVSNAQVELINARGKSRLAKVNLNNAMGVTEVAENPGDYTLVADVAYEPFKANLKESIDMALLSRDELAGADLKIRAWRSALAAAKSQYWPIITASAGFGPYIVSSDPANLLDNSTIKVGYNIGLNFSFPIFQGLTVRADIAEALGGIRTSTAQYNVVRQKIIQEAQESYFSVKYAEERYKATEHLVEQGERNLQLASGRFETGVGSAIEISDANLSLANAKIDRISALYQYQMEVDRFNRTIGQLRK